MDAKIYNLQNEEVSSIKVPDEIFDRKFSESLVKQVLLAQMANAREPWAHAKGRGEVRGGGRKPWKQKGTGRSRHGSIRSPIWKGGGKSHGPVKERDYSQKVNKKMKRVAIFAVLSKKFRTGEIKFMEDLNLKSGKTKEFAPVLANLSGKSAKGKKYDTLLIYAPESGRNLSMASRNLPKTKTLSSTSLNVYDLLNYKNLLIDQKAVAVISEHYKI